MNELDRKLARLALAKAIKTPLKSEIDVDPWNKSIIFNQPFLRDLHEQKQKQVRQTLSSSSPESPAFSAKRMSKSSKVKNRHAILPSDSEEEEEEEEEKEKGDKFNKNSEAKHQAVKSGKCSVFLAQTVAPEKKEKPPMKSKLAMRSDVVKAKSRESSSSRGSSPGFSSPVTEEDEDMYNCYPPKNSVAMEPVPMDPMYFQRLHTYQQQLQFQQYQHQLQQLYLLSQNPSVYFPASAGAWSDEQRRSYRGPHKKHRTPQTDLRRRAEMLRNSSEYHQEPNGYYYRKSHYC